MTAASARRWVVVVGAVAAAAIWIRLAVRPSSDLLNHREFGRRFASGADLYRGGLDYPYPPTWAAAHAPLAAVPARAASAVVFPVGLGALVLLLWIVESLTGPQRTGGAGRQIWIAAAAVALASRFVIRDLLDGGENTILTTLAWLAWWMWTRRRAWAGAALLAAAVALKLTAGAFLIVLVGWRERAQLVRTLVCLAAFMALPAMRMGIDAYGRALGVWGGAVWAGVSSGDPTVGVLGPEPPGNLALRPALGRLLVSPDASADARAMSAWIATLVTIAIVVSFAAWVWRRRSATIADRTTEWAAAGVLGLLISPITWRSHAVAMLPACYIAILRATDAGTPRRSTVAALVAVAVPGLVLTRGVFGEGVSAWTEQWSLATWAFMCLLVGVALLPRADARDRPRVVAVPAPMR